MSSDPFGPQYDDDVYYTPARAREDGDGDDDEYPAPWRQRQDEEESSVSSSSESSSQSSVEPPPVPLEPLLDNDAIRRKARHQLRHYRPPGEPVRGLDEKDPGTLHYPPLDPAGRPVPDGRRTHMPRQRAGHITVRVRRENVVHDTTPEQRLALRGADHFMPVRGDANRATFDVQVLAEVVGVESAESTAVTRANVTENRVFDERWATAKEDPELRGRFGLHRQANKPIYSLNKCDVATTDVHRANLVWMQWIHSNFEIALGFLNASNERLFADLSHRLLYSLYGMDDSGARANVAIQTFRTHGPMQPAVLWPGDVWSKSMREPMSRNGRVQANALTDQFKKQIIGFFYDSLATLGYQFTARRANLFFPSPDVTGLVATALPNQDIKDGPFSPSGDAYALHATLYAMAIAFMSTLGFESGADKPIAYVRWCSLFGELQYLNFDAHDGQWPLHRKLDTGFKFEPKGRLADYYVLLSAVVSAYEPCRTAAQRVYRRLCERCWPVVGQSSMVVTEVDVPKHITEVHGYRPCPAPRMQRLWPKHFVREHSAPQAVIDQLLVHNAQIDRARLLMHQAERKTSDSANRSLTQFFKLMDDYLRVTALAMPDSLDAEMRECVPNWTTSVAGDGGVRDTTMWFRRAARMMWLYALHSPARSQLISNVQSPTPDDVRHARHFRHNFNDLLVRRMFNIPDSLVMREGNDDRIRRFLDREWVRPAVSVHLPDTHVPGQTYGWLWMTTLANNVDVLRELCARHVVADRPLKFSTEPEVQSSRLQRREFSIEPERAVEIARTALTGEGIAPETLLDVPSLLHDYFRGEHPPQVPIESADPMGRSPRRLTDSISDLVGLELTDRVRLDTPPSTLLMPPVCAKNRTSLWLWLLAHEFLHISGGRYASKILPLLAYMHDLHLDRQGFAPYDESPPRELLDRVHTIMNETEQGRPLADIRVIFLQRMSPFAIHPLEDESVLLGLWDSATSIYYNRRAERIEHFVGRALANSYNERAETRRGFNRTVRERWQPFFVNREVFRSMLKPDPAPMAAYAGSVDDRSSIDLGIPPSDERDVAGSMAEPDSSDDGDEASEFSGPFTRRLTQAEVREEMERMRQKMLQPNPPTYTIVDDE